MLKSRMYILTEIEASKRVEVYKDKKELWKGYSIVFAILTAVAWVFYALIEMGIWTLAGSSDPMAVMGVMIPMYAFSMREMDIYLWRPPTIKEMDEIGDKII